MKLFRSCLVSIAAGSVLVAGSASAEKKELIASLTGLLGDDTSSNPKLYEVTQIYSNGEVTYQRSSDPEGYIAANLSSVVIENIIERSKRAEKLDLQDLEPGSDGCKVFAISTYSIFKKGIEVKVMERTNCKKSINPSAFNLGIDSLLDGLSEFSIKSPL